MASTQAIGSHVAALVVAAFACATAQGATPEQAFALTCAYAPSQSEAVRALATATGSPSAALAAVAKAMRLEVVEHSSGAPILRGNGGYIAKTIRVAVAGPVIITVGLVVAGAALTVEMVCAPTNYPTQTARVKAAAIEFARRSKDWVVKHAKAIGYPSVTSSSLTLKQSSDDVFEQAYRF